MCYPHGKNLGTDEDPMNQTLKNQCHQGKFECNWIFPLFQKILFKRKIADSEEFDQVRAVLAFDETH